MIQDASLSMPQMAAVLDNAPVAVYVSAADNWELLYVNRLAKQFLPLDTDQEGLTCYQAAGYDAPCPFCQTAQMDHAGLMVREFSFPRDQRIYQLSGKLIDWDGRPAHIEYILDITDRRQKEDRDRALREELVSTFSSIPCGLCVYRLCGGQIVPLFHNAAFYELMGYSQAHIQRVERETDYLNVHAEDLAPLQEKIQHLIQCGGVMQHTYRVWNDNLGAYRWIRLDGSVKTTQNETLLYAVYTNVTEQLHLEQELMQANAKLQVMVNAIPGGVAIYKVSDIFQTVYFSDGVPELSGYTVEEYRELIKGDAAQLTYQQDTQRVVSTLRQAIRDHRPVEFEFRKQHRDGHVVWVRIQAKQIGEEDGCPLLHCVFHNISALKETQLELDHLINFIPGGIASYLVEGTRFIPTFFSDGVPALSGHSREEFEQLVRHDALDIIYEPDRERVLEAAQSVMSTGGVLDISYRMLHKNGTLIWIHLNGRPMDPLADKARFYAVFTGMSSETKLFQTIANESADGIYVIDQKTYELLYVNESRKLFMDGKNCLGQKCYAALHGQSAPCPFCTLNTPDGEGKDLEMAVPNTGRYYSTRFHRTDWNGIPAYVNYVRDVTKDVKIRQEKERLEQYFQTVVKNLPGGVAVVHYEADGSMTPEYLSDGFAALTGMTQQQAWQLYCQDAMAGVHPEDRDAVKAEMDAYTNSGKGHCELIYRLRSGQDGYLWVRNTLSLIRSNDGKSRVYAFYHDITKEREEQERIRQQYNDLIVQHYQMPGPNALIIGHCNITQNRILEIIDHTNSDLLEHFSSVREAFFTGMSSFIVDEDERNTFLNTYLNAPSLAAFLRNDTEQVQKCFIHLPQESMGRYVQIKMNLVSTPDTGDVTGILTVTDITEQTISNRILYQLSMAGYDFVVDLDLNRDHYRVISNNNDPHFMPPAQGCHSQWMQYMLASHILPKDKEQYRRCLDIQYIKRRFETGGPFTFAFSLVDENGDIRTKNMTVSPIDLRLGRVCLSRSDITESVREQQGLLRAIAYTFELAGFIDVNNGRLTLHTRNTVLENLPPYCSPQYGQAIGRFVDQCSPDDPIYGQLQLSTMLNNLSQKPSGYDLLFSYPTQDGERYKQIAVLWGDANRKTICLVRADVTEMLAAERQTKRELENALALAEEASRAKGDFLSSMSHDIRTPMNAIMGMTALAVAHLDNQERVADCLQKISVSSHHLLSLINDILDMSKIERSKISLNRMLITLPELVSQLSDMMAPQARASGLHLSLESRQVVHQHFYGDSLRVNQILINLLSNALKFTPEGGRVDFLAEELPAEREGNARYRFTVSDTGIGMTPEFCAHIFDPFTRSSSATRIEGSGLGLSITKGLVDLMGGQITVDSRLHQGSRFQVELEFEAAPEGEVAHSPCAQARPADAGAEKLLGGRHFLVAEDNAINAEILCELLWMNGARSTVKTDGAQAVKAFQDAEPGTYDAILMDIQMPVMNGYEATRVIRRLNRPDAGSIPIIAMTANAFAEDVQASRDAGMTAHVAKPIDIDVLQNTLIQVLPDQRR